MDLTNIRGIAFDVDGVLSPNTIPIGEDGQPCRLLNVKDGYAIQLAVKKGLKLAIISGGRSKAVALRYRNLGVDDVYMGAAFKLPIFERWLEEAGLDASEVIFVGDDIPDLRVMEHAGISVAPADAAWQLPTISRPATAVMAWHARSSRKCSPPTACGWTTNTPSDGELWFMVDSLWFMEGSGER